MQSRHDTASRISIESHLTQKTCRNERISAQHVISYIIYKIVFNGKCVHNKAWINLTFVTNLFRVSTFLGQFAFLNFQIGRLTPRTDKLGLCKLPLDPCEDGLILLL